ncbi:excinuclease ABC subunit UvrC, partial [bacterium]|nr:excinuclease ABC subunit UvrC [bacterium]
RFLDAEGKPLYIGKATDLRARVGSWLSKHSGEPPKANLLRAAAVRVEFTVTASEAAALVLEADLIRRHRPKFNVDLKDDKSFPWLRLVPDRWPYLALARSAGGAGISLGPFTSGRAVRETIRFLERRFGVRPCRADLSKGTVKACVYYRLRQCPAPCEQKVGEDEYGRMVGRAMAFLEGDASETLEELAAQMKTAAARREYELAAQLRDRRQALAGIFGAQESRLPPRANLDLVAVARGKGLSVLSVTSLRGGRQAGPRIFPLDDPLGEPLSVVVERALSLHYRNRRPPKTILVGLPKTRPFPLLERTLCQGRRTRIRPPRWVWERERYAAEEKNAHIQLDRLLQDQRPALDPTARRALADLDRRLGLGAPPRHLEAYDISNLMGDEPVAGQVLFTNGRYDKRGKRLYRIRTVAGANDPAMMAEAIDRRCRRIAEGGETAPDLILVDGGKAQVNAAQAAVASWFLHIPVAGLAKRRETVYAGSPPKVVEFAARSPGHALLMRARDEAHRVANSFHRKRRSKSALGQA